MARLFASAVWLLILTAPPAFADFSGKVVAVHDGDTISVLHNGRGKKIRLNGIDCPEKGQAFSTRAKQATADLAFGKEVTLQTYGQDKHGRTIGDVILPHGQLLNHELVRAGMCWWYRKYAPLDVVLEGLEKEQGKPTVGSGVIRTPCRRGSGESLVERGDHRCRPG